MSGDRFSSWQLELLGRVSCALDPAATDAGVAVALDVVCEGLEAWAGRVFLSEPRGGDHLLYASCGEPTAVTRERNGGSAEGELSWVVVSIPGRERELGRLQVGWAEAPPETIFLSEVARAMGVALQARFAALRAEVRSAIQAAGSSGCLTGALEALRSSAGATTAELSFRRPGARVFRRVADGDVGDGGGCPYRDDPTRCSVVQEGHAGRFHADHGAPAERCRGPRPDGGHLCLPLYAQGGPRGSILLALGDGDSTAPTRDLVPLLEQADEASAVIAERLDPNYQHNATGLQIRCFGRFELSSDGRPIPREHFARAKAWELLKHLAVQAGKPVEQVELVAALWPDARSKPGLNRLYGIVHALRRVFEPAGGPFTRVLRQGTGYMLDPTRVWVDVVEFRERLQEGRRDIRGGNPDAALVAFEEACDLYLGDLLATDPLVEWCDAERLYLRREFLGASEQLAALYLGRGDPASAVNALTRAVAVEPLREDLQQRLVRTLLLQGRLAEARERLRQCVRVLLDDFDMDPAPETVDLMREVGLGPDARG